MARARKKNIFAPEGVTSDASGTSRREDYRWSGTVFGNSREQQDWCINSRIRLPIALAFQKAGDTTPCMAKIPQRTCMIAQASGLG
jgi:hypothetical protein